MQDPTWISEHIQAVDILRRRLAASTHNRHRASDVLMAFRRCQQHCLRFLYLLHCVEVLELQSLGQCLQLQTFGPRQV